MEPKRPEYWKLVVAGGSEEGHGMACRWPLSMAHSSLKAGAHVAKASDTWPGESGYCLQETEVFSSVLCSVVYGL